MNDFRTELAALINKHSLENGSDTPDLILAEYLTDCLTAFDKAARQRREWYSPDWIASRELPRDEVKP